jgi:hypothetical protein
MKRFILKAFLILFVLGFLHQFTVEGKGVADQVKEILQPLEEKYGIKIQFEDVPPLSWPDVEYKLATSADMNELLRYVKIIFQEEFIKYPPSFIQKSHLQTIVLVKSLDFGKQRRSAVPDCYKEILVLDFKAANYDQAYQRHVIHHEFYHMIEEEFNHDPYFKDPQWAKLNPVDFKYGEGGASVQQSSEVIRNLPHPKPGFIDPYAMSGLEEDKAEIYAALFIKAEYLRTKVYAVNDDILASKFKFMEEFLSGIDSSLDPSFWKKVHGE